MENDGPDSVHEKKKYAGNVNLGLKLYHQGCKRRRFNQSHRKKMPYSGGWVAFF
ncbi:hypothetical protein DESC_610180 [Desulfosarcina cetonica]|nr:hypothetical protein DESC_610180 [Desulfosarcina cetonica]